MRAHSKTNGKYLIKSAKCTPASVYIRVRRRPSSLARATSVLALVLGYERASRQAREPGTDGSFTPSARDFVQSPPGLIKTRTTHLVAAKGEFFKRLDPPGPGAPHLHPPTRVPSGQGSSVQRQLYGMRNDDDHANSAGPRNTAKVETASRPRGLSTPSLVGGEDRCEKQNPRRSFPPLHGNYLGGTDAARGIKGFWNDFEAVCLTH